ncbi:hypothetical protein [Streptomyces sp. SP18CS02]|uniref:hypothetical protein n=1 Tax=Streptomyces sp. SP18CS02 TaxID=3002531 RepID=UPI002E79149C|nr:hypothetical protein [Streptomyces sp. SP18CS02]MEE1751741.1 hypothetical protein [Streptomyces sp. SP18CS02]
MTVRSAWLLSSGQTREDTRLTTSALLTPNGELTARAGVVPGGFALTGVSAMQCAIGTGRAVVQGAADQGAYPVAVTEPETLTVADGDPTYPRIDRIVLDVEDHPYDGSGETRALVRIVPGTPAAVPAEPALPVSSLPLYSVTVRAGASAGNGGIDWTTAVVNRRHPTAALGGIVPAAGFDGMYAGQYRDANGRLERWNGTAWTAYPPPPVWRNWTPAWTTSSGSATPAYGNALIDCRYVHSGPTVHVNFRIVFGSTTRFGAGTTADNWRFSLPVPAATPTQGIGFAELTATTSERVMARMRCTGTAFFELEVSSGKPNATAVAGTGLADAVTPWAWASAHAIIGSATYEAAV